MKLLALVKFLRVKPFDVSTAEGRSQERYRLALWSLLANIVSKIMAFAVIMLSVKWTLPYLGAERFGVWMTVASFTMMLVVLDLGIGNALINHAAHTAAEDDTPKLAKTISGSLGFLLIVSCVMSLLLYTLVLLLPLEKLIKVKDASLMPEIKQTLLVFGVLFGFNLFGSGVQKLFAGLQRGFEGLLASATCSGLALLALWWAARLEAGTPYLLIATLGAQSLGGYVLLVLLIKRKLFVFKGLSHEILQQYKELFKSSGFYFVLQLGFLLGTGADSLIISSTLGAASVAVYSIVQRLFQISSMTSHMFSGPLWGAYADASARHDKNFIRATFFRSMKLTFVLSLLIIAIILIFSDEILKIWLSNNITIPPAFLWAFALFAFFECMLISISIFLNGMHIIKPQIVKVVVMIAISLPLKLWLVHDYGVTAIPLVAASSFFVAIFIVYGVVYKKMIKMHLY